MWKPTGMWLVTFFRETGSWAFKLPFHSHRHAHCNSFTVVINQFSLLLWKHFFFVSSSVYLVSTVRVLALGETFWCSLVSVYLSHVPRPSAKAFLCSVDCSLLVTWMACTSCIVVSVGTNVVGGGGGRRHIASAFTYAPPMEALCSPQRFAPAFETKQRHHREEYNLHTDVKVGSLGLSFRSQVMYIWRLARPYFSFLVSASLLNLKSQKMNRRLKYTGGDTRITRGLTVLWGLSSVRVIGRQRGKSVLENEMVVFVLRAGPLNTIGTVEGLGVRFRDKLWFRALTLACLREWRLDVGVSVGRSCLARRHRFTLRFDFQAVPNLGQLISFSKRAPASEDGARPLRICGAQCSREQATLPAPKISGIFLQPHSYLFHCCQPYAVWRHCSVNRNAPVILYLKNALSH